MDKQTQRVVGVKSGGKVLIWLALLIFFIYSYQAIIDWESIVDPRRHRAVIRILTALTQPNLTENETTSRAAEEMWETIQIAFLATSISAIFAIPFAFFGATPSSPWGRGLNVLLQIILAAVRGVHPLLIVIFAVVLAGIGPTAGVLALILFSTAVLIANFSEYVQQHPSLSWPALLKIHFPGLAFRHFYVSILIATVLGFMGGGGIGFVLQQDINLLNYRNASVAIWMIIIAGGSLDLLSRAVWYNIQSSGAYHLSAIEKEEENLKFNTPLTPR